MAPNPDRRGAGGVARAKTKMVDDGHELMQLAYDANKMSLLVTPDNKEVVDIYTKATGYTCRKVRVCKEVVEFYQPERHCLPERFEADKTMINGQQKPRIG